LDTCRALLIKVIYVSKKCKEIYFEKLVSRVASANSELVFNNSYESAVSKLYDITRDICKPRESKSITVRVKSMFHNCKMLVTLDVEKSQINSQYIIVFKFIVKL
jgi:hypothetical protein